MAELIGIGAIVLSLVFVGLEMRQSRDLALAQLYQDQIAAGYAHADTVFQASSVLAKANRQDELTDEEVIALRALFRSIWGFGFFGHTRWMLLDNDAAANAPLVEVAVMLDRYPGLRLHWDEWISESSTKYGLLRSVDDIDSLNLTPTQRYMRQVNAYLEALDTEN